MKTKESSYNYGLNIFFNPKEVPEPSAVFALPEVIGAVHMTPLPEGDGVLVHIPKADYEDTVRIRLNGSCRIVIAVEAGTTVTLLEEGRAGSLSIDLDVAAGADVRYIALRSGGVEFARRRAAVATDAKLAWTTAHIGAKFAYGRTSTRLTGRGSSVRERAMYLGADGDCFDLHSEVVHEADASVSDLLTRGALAGRSKAIVRGLVRIPEGTRACIGKQKEDTLLLGPDAEVDAVPMLEIGTDDVRCGHSASTSQLDDESLFYLMSRGLDRRAAGQAVVEGFFAPVLEDCGEAFRASLGLKIARIV
ncbi:SufD family Fe-S cluster assembly protein [Candidatus Uhrbacteria bacterium]|nr:SufD family Fe-S cluster assembly protein [Candidatus Uhrbacteria bacterium]